MIKHVLNISLTILFAFFIGCEKPSPLTPQENQSSMNTVASSVYAPNTSTSGNLNWSSWKSMPNNIKFASDPASVSWGSGRLDVFGRGTDNTLYHNYNDGNWHTWTQMSGEFYGNPSVVSWAPNRLHVFVRGGGNQCYFNYWEGTRWIGWMSLGGSLASDPTVVSRGPGLLDVFSRSTDNLLIHNWYDGSWHGWETLSGWITGKPAVASREANLLDVVVRGGGNHIWHRKYNGFSWRDWKNLGGDFISNPAIAPVGGGRQNVGGRQDVFCINNNQEMQTNFWQGGAIGFYKQPGEYYKDFFITKKGEEYHLFSNVGIAGPTQDWISPGNEKEFIHATTTDFNNWSVKPRVMQVRRGTWEDCVVTAPSIQFFNGVYHMMYGGFAPNYVQRVGYATSTDLYNWTRYPQNPTFVAPSWGISSECRDSHIIRYNNQWVMYTTTKHKDGSGAISLDVSSNLASWSNIGCAVKQAGVDMESPAVFENNGKWFLFISSTGTAAYTANSPLSTNWTKLSSFQFAPGYFAYEFINTGNQWIASAFSWTANGNHIKFWKLEFDANGNPFIDF